MVENAGFQVLGFLPNYLMIRGEGESLILYGRPYGNGATLRSSKRPTVIPEIKELARHVLQSFGFNPTLEVCEDAIPFARNQSFSLEEVDRLSLAQLARIEQGRIVEPLLFGKLSLDEGHSFARRQNAVYLMAVDKTKRPGRQDLRLRGPSAIQPRRGCAFASHRTSRCRKDDEAECAVL